MQTRASHGLSCSPPPSIRFKGMIWILPFLLYCMSKWSCPYLYYGYNIKIEHDFLEYRVLDYTKVNISKFLSGNINFSRFHDFDFDINYPIFRCVCIYIYIYTVLMRTWYYCTLQGVRGNVTKPASSSLFTKAWFLYEKNRCIRHSYLTLSCKVSVHQVQCTFNVN